MYNILLAASQAQSCTPPNYVTFRDRTLEGVDTPIQVTHPGRFLATAYIFGCNGVITNWEVYTLRPEAHPIEFHVWRANETRQNVYHLVGINTFQDAQPVDNYLSFSVPADQQITVAPGDFAGIRTVESVNGGESGYRIQFDDGGNYSQYVPGSSMGRESFSTPLVLDLNFPVPGDFSTVSFPRSPIMRATVQGECRYSAMYFCIHLIRISISHSSVYSGTSLSSGHFLSSH